MGDVVSRMQSFEDARLLARQRVPKSIFQLFEAGSGSNITVRENRAAFEEVLFRPRAAVFHPERNLRTTVLGHDVSMPVIVSSVGALQVGHMDGEVGVARAAGDAGVIQFVSGMTNMAIEDILDEASGPIFFQLYYVGGREASQPIIERVADVGVDGLVLIVDTAATHYGRDRTYDERAYVPMGVNPKEAVRFAPQALRKPAWLADFIRGGMAMPKAAMAIGPDGKPMSWTDGGARIYDETPDWGDLPWIRSLFDGPIVLKGIQTAEDARRAVDEGVDAIVVSNHGGNMLDGSRPTLRVLPEVIEAVDDRIEVLLDSGVRHGNDVVKALALGARAVGIGRAYVYPFLAAGEEGVRHVLELFRRQIDDALKFLGVQSVHDLDPSYLELPAAWEVKEHLEELQLVSH